MSLRASTLNAATLLEDSSLVVCSPPGRFSPSHTPSRTRCPFGPPLVSLLVVVPCGVVSERAPQALTAPPCYWCVRIYAIWREARALLQRNREKIVGDMAQSGNKIFSLLWVGQVAAIVFGFGLFVSLSAHSHHPPASAGARCTFLRWCRGCLGAVLMAVANSALRKGARPLHDA